MNPSRYFMSNMAINPMMIRNGYRLSGGMGLLERMTSGIKSFNWGKLLNGANKTLNVMNQTIPLIRQAQPVINNARNIFKIAKAFGKETTVSNTVNSVIKKDLDASKNTNNNPIFFV